MKLTRHSVFGVTYSAYALLYATRKPFSVVKILVQNELGLTADALGLIDTAFLGAYAAGQIVLPVFLTSKGYSPAHSLFVLYLGSGLVSLAFGLSSSPLTLLILWLVNGFLHSAVFPLLLQCISPWVPSQTRGFIMGCWTTSQQMGALTATLLASYFASKYGWRTVFIYPGLLTIAGSFALLKLIAQIHTVNRRLEQQLSSTHPRPHAPSVSLTQRMPLAKVPLGAPGPGLENGHDRPSPLAELPPHHASHHASLPISSTFRDTTAQALRPLASKGTSHFNGGASFGGDARFGADAKFEGGANFGGGATFGGATGAATPPSNAQSFTLELTETPERAAAPPFRADGGSAKDLAKDLGVGAGAGAGLGVSDCRGVTSTVGLREKHDGEKHDGIGDGGGSGLIAETSTLADSCSAMGEMGGERGWGMEANPSWKRLVRIRDVQLLSGSYFGIKCVRYSLLFWLPYYLVTELLYTPARAGYCSIAFDIGGIVGGVLIGQISDKFFKGRRLLVSLLSCLLAALALPVFAAASKSSALLTLVWMALIGFAVAGADSILGGSAAADICERHGLSASALAVVTGMINGSGSIGAVLQAYLTAFISSRFGWAVLYTSLSAACLLSALALVPPAVAEHKSLVNSARLFRTRLPADTDHTHTHTHSHGGRLPAKDSLTSNASTMSNVQTVSDLSTTSLSSKQTTARPPMTSNGPRNSVSLQV